VVDFVGFKLLFFLVFIALIDAFGIIFFNNSYLKIAITIVATTILHYMWRKLFKELVYLE